MQSILTLVLTALPTLFQTIPSLLNTTHPAVVASTAVASSPDVDQAFVELIQTALNAAQTAGYITFGAPLAVDGDAGPLTTAAFTALLTKLGVAV